MNLKLIIFFVIIIFIGNASANLNDCELIQINSTHWYFETNQTDLAYGEYNYQAFANNISSEYRTLNVSFVEDSSFTVTLPVGELQGNFTADNSTHKWLGPDGQEVGTAFFVVENTGNIVQSFRFYINDTVNNVIYYTSLSGDLSSPVELNTTTTTVIITDLAVSGSDDVWIYANLTQPAPGTYSRNMTINSS